jgi:hypothetical protein
MADSGTRPEHLGPKGETGAEPETRGTATAHSRRKRMLPEQRRAGTLSKSGAPAFTRPDATRKRGSTGPGRDRAQAV